MAGTAGTALAITASSALAGNVSIERSKYLTKVLQMDLGGVLLAVWFSIVMPYCTGGIPLPHFGILSGLLQVVTKVKPETARNKITAAIIGLIVLAAAYVIFCS